MRTYTVFLGFCVLSLSGCPADEEGNGETGGSDGSGSGESSTAGTSTNGQSSTSAGTGTSASTTTAGTDGGGSSGGAEGSTGGVDGESAGGDPCVGLSRAECNANPDCSAITCSPFVMSPDPGGTPWCIGDQEFVGCQSADIGCDDVRTTACMGNDAPTFACPSSCIPAGWSECPPPVDGMIPMCP